MNYQKKPFLRLILSLIVLIVGVSCVVVCCIVHAGHERIEFLVKSNNGLTEKVYLKTNGEVVVLSKSPQMRMIAEQDNYITLHEESIMYKNTTDTLYIVLCMSIMSDSSEIQPSPNDLTIKYIYEQKYRQEVINYYAAMGYDIFPSAGYL